MICTKNGSNVTHLLISGLFVDEEIILTPNKKIKPVVTKPSIETISSCSDDIRTYSTTILSLENIGSQLKIEGTNAKELAIEAWNAQWDVLLLSAVFRSPIISDIQSDGDFNTLSDKNKLTSINPWAYGIYNKTYVIDSDGRDWIQKHYAVASEMCNEDQLQTAIQSLSFYKYYPNPRIQLAILWAGIESIFNVSSELSNRLSVGISIFLGKDLDDAKKIRSDVKDLYNVRSKAVHGSAAPKKKKISNPVEYSASLLNRIIIKCIDDKHLPIIEELELSVFDTNLRKCD